MPPPFSSARGFGAPHPRPSPRERSGRRGRARGERPGEADGLRSAAGARSRPPSGEPGPRAAPETAAAGCAGASLPGGAAAAAWKMAAPCGSELPANSPLKIPKMEVLSPASPGGLSDGNPSLSDPSTPRGASPLGPGSATGSGAAASGGLGLGLGGRSAASSSVSFSPGGGGGGAAAAAAAACRGMSWTPAETNALIAVWGNERLVEARYQQLEGAGTVFGSKAPGPAMYERVSRALAELGYERTPSQCRERIKTLRRCYSRVKEHGVGKRKSSYTFEQLEQVFGQGGWDAQPCQPVLINSSGLYQELESDGSTMEEYSQEDWGNHSQDLHGYPTDQELDEIPVTKRTLKIKQESSEEAQKRDIMQNIVQILESVQLKWELFQSWTDFSRLHLSNKLAIFGIGYNTRWKEDIRYHYAEISSQVPLGKRLREYFNSEKPEGRIIMTRVQKMNWKNVYYKFLEITISEARCLELHMEIDWIPIAHSKPTGGNVVQYLLPGGIPKSPGLYAIGYEECIERPPSPHMERRSLDPGKEGRVDLETLSAQASLQVEIEPTRIIYCYLGIAEVRTLQQCLFLHFQANTKTFSKDWVGINGFLSQNCIVDPGVSPKSIYIKFVEVERDFLSAGSLVECLEKAIGYPLKFNN
ncbi:myb/SANT-like DNA-binding domain-containing protein 2 isoform X1 [Leopardus geoffroyi]|uniref:Myb/SANT-like DNA-binding domain-containing protein 2 isoform X1 n=9 Tax=Laurasiatheria TaxID=314145 RepID=A0A6J1XJG5_ACIJB|nr:myb/SANT-like DNA-binding domain-containing protein 2 isoform X1 [Felis catus]XP_026892625.1 myb/SANT-like DNA-binding domain-containing protein 2 isoform X1 [Acinonyx jubatus]XP_040339328.1 myb/SANT-like DNA-binding domain-containing protein 2 isoform X1 [Puma yagouaroundi]XP_043435634.1 myb/SANT-like DNA-binding domain-containing protein 2 isoform X1 [Prionailurus bengalensis]XP_045339259.1 myb/SANT-like DNA-binding domain-containing protein 2 isoform X1 [Leopardus geoffroyi]XP_058543131.